MASASEILKAYLHCARTPAEDAVERIRTQLKKQYGAAEVELTVSVEPDLISGYVLQVGGRVFDNSGKSALAAITADAPSLAVMQTRVEDYKPAATTAEGGTVISAADGVVDVKGMDQAVYGEIVTFDNGAKGMVESVEPDHLGIMLFDKIEEVPTSSIWALPCSMRCSLSHFWPFFESSMNSWAKLPSWMRASTVFIAAFVSSALAFCLARFRFPGRRALFALVIGTMIIPGTTLIITQYQLASFFKLTNKLLGLVPFYVAWVIPFSTFMIKGYIESIPREFDEAVYMDGGSVFTVFFKVICPLASPAIASVSIFNFLTAWEEFPWALTVLNDTQKRTLPIAISGFFGQHQFTQWGYVFAMSVASLLPVLIIFICCQKYFVSGLQTGGIKG
mgnify:CR=1 FL=1